MKIISLIPCVVISLLGVSVVYADENNIILSGVWLNGVDRRREILVFEKENKNYAECSVLNKMRIKVDLLEKYENQSEYCLLNNEKVSSEIDEESQVIKIQMPSNYFESQEFDFNTLLNPDPASLGGYLNYSFYFEDSSPENREYSALTELGVFKDYWLFNYGMLVRSEDSEAEGKINDMYRLDTALSIDFPDKLTRLIVGDTTTVSNPFVNSFRFGGISFGTSFTERPDFVYWNAPTLRGSAVLPSKVDLLLNGVSLYQQEITPGDYVLQTGLNIQQGGNAQIVVEDVLGNRTVQNIPLLINNRLLLPELNEYNVSLGKLRYNYNITSNDYQDFFTNLYFRRGINHNTTLGFNMAYSDDIKNLGLMWTQALGQIGVVDFYAATSHANQGDGYSVGASLSKYWNKVSVGVSASYYTDDYEMLGYNDGVSANKYDVFSYLNVNDIPWIGNFNLSYIQRENYDVDSRFSKNSILRTGISKSFNQLVMGVSYYNNIEPDNDHGIDFSVSYNFGGGHNVSATQSTNDYSSLDYRFDPLDNNYDFGFGGERRDGISVYQAYGNYENRFGDMSGQYLYSSEFHNLNFSYEGAIVVLNGKPAFTQYVDNSFALVKVGNYPDIDVYRSLSPVGKTNKDGTFWVSDIVPYVKYDISFNLDQLNMDDKVEYPNKQIVGLSKRGYIVDFPVYQSHRIVVRLLNLDGNVFVPGSEVYINHNNEDFYPIDAEGKVYLYGLVPGTYSIFVKTIGGESCNSELNIPTEKVEQFASKTIDLVCK